MSSKLHIKEGWLRALVFFFFGVLASGGIASLLESGMASGFFGGSRAETGSVIDLLIKYIINQTGIISLLILFRLFIDKTSLTSLGFYLKGFLNDALLGALIAVVIITLGTIVLYYGGNLTIKNITFNFGNTICAVLLFVCVAFAEEIVFRGYILSGLMESMNRWLALAISAILFTLIHLANPDITLMAGINIFIAGILLGVNYIYTKNIWFAIFFHFAWNFFQGTVLGYHVSGIPIATGFLEIFTTGPNEIGGGPFGFEGSILAAILQVIAIAGLALMYEKKYGKSLITKPKIKVD